MIQVLLLIAAVLLAAYFFTQRKKAFAKAWVKIGFAVMAVAAVWAILRPDDLTILANWLGVDRGTDLMLYVLIIAFFFTTMSTWVRFRELELRYARLARAVALQNDVKPQTLSADAAASPAWTEQTEPVEPIAPSYPAAGAQQTTPEFGSQEATTWTTYPSAPRHYRAED